MKKLMILMVVLSALNSTMSAQKFFTKDGKIKFDATVSRSLETIEALSNSGTCVLDTESGKMQWAVLIKGFRFEKALMQEHFNENYMESSKFPKATFLGQITNMNEVNFAEDGVYNAIVAGKMKIHGITKEISTNGALTVAEGQIKLNAGFSLLLADYNISIPSLVSDKIGKEAKVLIDATLLPLK